MKGSKATKNGSQNVSHSGLGLDMTTAGKGLAEEGGENLWWEPFLGLCIFLLQLPCAIQCTCTVGWLCGCLVFKNWFSVASTGLKLIAIQYKIILLL